MSVAQHRFYSILIIVCLIGVFYFRSRYILTEIQENKRVTEAVIYEVRPSRSALNIRFRFKDENDSTIYVRYKLMYSIDARKILLNRSFPVIYSSKKVTLNKLLITEKDFNKYGVPFPDSLKAVNKELSKY
jgi:hypothetical protein